MLLRELKQGSFENQGKLSKFQIIECDASSMEIEENFHSDDLEMKYELTRL